VVRLAYRTFVIIFVGVVNVVLPECYNLTSWQLRLDRSLERSLIISVNVYSQRIR